MTELILHYILPNVAVFGGLFLLAKAVEKTTLKFIVWYCDNY